MPPASELVREGIEVELGLAVERHCSHYTPVERDHPQPTRVGAISDPREEVCVAVLPMFFATHHDDSRARSEDACFPQALREESSTEEVDAKGLLKALLRHTPGDGHETRIVDHRVHKHAAPYQLRHATLDGVEAVQVESGYALHGEVTPQVCGRLAREQRGCRVVCNERSELIVSEDAAVGQHEACSRCCKVANNTSAETGRSPRDNDGSMCQHARARMQARCELRHIAAISSLHEHRTHEQARGTRGVLGPFFHGRPATLPHHP
mmetsp:Transcript_3616/g.10661  ORF Transcript_3616/g.10661 Transcript_3616/m.10661 type:complete len:266 (-) Transcript_3616:91-888(-)